MFYDDLRVDNDTEQIIQGLTIGQVERFTGRPTHGVPITRGFECTDSDHRMLGGVPTSLITTSILQVLGATTVNVVYGILVFDHNPSLRGVPRWQPYPVGALTAGEMRGPYQAAIVYGHAHTGQTTLAARLFWSGPGQPKDKFRGELGAYLQK